MTDDNAGKNRGSFARRDCKNGPVPVATIDDKPPDFSPLVQDAAMQEILNRRWAECLVCIAHAAPLSATVMMGGLVEALLLARVNREANKAPIITANTAPRDKSGKTLMLTEWTLKGFLDVAHELNADAPLSKRFLDELPVPWKK